MSPSLNLAHDTTPLIPQVWEHPESEKLWCEEIDVGEDQPRQIASGLRKFMTAEEMVGADVLVVCNLKAAKVRAPCAVPCAQGTRALR